MIQINQYIKRSLPLAFTVTSNEILQITRIEPEYPFTLLRTTSSSQCNPVKLIIPNQSESISSIDLITFKGSYVD